MRNRSIGVGVFLLIAGAILLLINTGIINARWVLDAVLDLWPLFLVVIGINIIAGKRQAVKIIAWVLLVAVIITYGYINNGRQQRNIIRERNNMYTAEKYAETEKGDLKLSLGGLNFDIGGGSNHLLEGMSTNPAIKHFVEYDDGNRIARVDIRQRGDKMILNFLRDRNGHTYRLNLNDNVVWDIEAMLGAVNGTMDLSDVKVDNMKLYLGAGNLNIIFGATTEMTNVEIKAGTSNVDLVFPRESGVRLEVMDVFCDTDFEELNWEMKDGYYFSPNYDESRSKINVDISMGIGSLSVAVQ